MTGKFTSLTLAGVALFSAATAAHAAPLITEFLTVNNTGILDEDSTRQDWIELHNPDAAPADLSGYHLTDTATLPTRFTLPSGFIIPPGGYVVVFASGKNRTASGSPVHTNFSLSSAGEYLGLFAPGGAGAAISEYAPLYPVQGADVSYGLTAPSAGAPGAFFNTPTPGAANNVSFSPAEQAVISVNSRTFNQGTTFPVELTTQSGTATIRYTLNRSIPINVDGVAPDVTVDPATDIWSTAAPHGLQNGDPVTLAGTPPANEAGIGINYFVTVLSPVTFQLSTEPGGLPLNLTTAGGAMHVRRHAAQAVSAVGTNWTLREHRFYAGDAVMLSTTGALPSPLTTTNTYYVLVVDRNIVRLSATSGGSSIAMSGGTGIHTMRRIPSPVYTAPITIPYSLRLRARTFEAGRMDGPMVSASYLMLDATAQAFTSNIPVMILHSFGSGHPNVTAPVAPAPEDTKEDVWFTFEPKPEGVPPTVSMVTRLTNPPDLVAPGYFERRGSSTFGATKYSMTTGAYDDYGNGMDVSPLGFASNDDFVLNAHFQFDRSLMHNDLIYRLSNEAGRWAPQTKHVEVFMSVLNDVTAAGGLPAYGVVNGAATSADYFGIFSFQDKISRGNNRINIAKMGPLDNTAPNVQGGYVFKIDRLDSGDTGVVGGGRTFALVQPKERTAYPAGLPVATEAQKTYLGNTLNAMQTALNGASFMDPAAGYAAHLDVPAAIDHWWLSILPKSADAFRLSGYWHKDRFGKLVMGPIFDFDRAMGSTDGRDLNPLTWRGDVPDLGTDYFHNASIYSPNYFQRMFDDPNYWQATIDRYEELRRGVLSTAHVHSIIDEWTELLDPGNGTNTPAKRNGLKWTSAAPYRPAAANTPGTDGTFRGETQWLKNWWGKAGAVTANGRFDFVDGQFMRPPVGSLPSGPVPSGSGVSLTSPHQVIPGVKIYYTTDGTDPRSPATAPQALFVPTALTTLATFIPDISTVRAIVPNAATVGGANGVEWRGADLNANGNNVDDFDDSTWFTNAAGTINGVGYDDDTAVSYLPYISVRWSTPTTPVAPNNNTNTMRNVNGSCYTRLAFTLSAADIAQMVAGTKLTLSMRYDDAFVAWINGTTVANSDNTTTSVSWNTVNSTSREANLPPIAGQEFDLTPYMNVLHEGQNILAVQGINGANTGSSDLLLQSKLTLQGSPTAQPAYTPSLTAGATEFTAPLNITVPTRVIARTLHPLLASDPPTANGGGTGPLPNGSSWSAPVELFYFPGAAAASQAGLQITEVHYHPTAPTATEIAAGFTNANNFEFIRLTNTSATPLDLTGIYFSAGVDFTSPQGLQNWLPTGASVVVVDNIAAFTSRYGSSFTILGAFSGDLSDGGETITLNDRTGAVISTFTYDDVAPWPTEADGSSSLLYVSGPQGEGGSWKSSVDPGGSMVTNYAAWAARHFAGTAVVAGDQAPGADADQDGLNNLGEYAFATNPNISGSREHLLAGALLTEPGVFTATRRKGATDLTFTAQAATTLQDWGAVVATPVLVDNGDGTETGTWTLPAGAVNRIYVRLLVTSP